MEGKFKVGDKVWSTKRADDIHHSCCRISMTICINQPMQKTISQIEYNKEGKVIYGVGDFHFTDNDVGVFIFDNFDDALESLK